VHWRNIVFLLIFLAIAQAARVGFALRTGTPGLCAFTVTLSGM